MAQARTKSERKQRGSVTYSTDLELGMRYEKQLIANMNDCYNIKD